MLFPDATDDGLGPVVLSAADLRAAAACEHALLVGLDVRVGRTEPVQRPVDEVLERAAELGLAHEQRVLARLARERPGAVRGAPSPEPSRAGYDGGMAATLALMADPAVEVIHQACVFDGELLGFVDLLVREPDGSWVVCETKLARSESVTALLQAGAYAAILEEAATDLDEVRLAPFVRLILGDDEVSDTRLADLLPVVRSRRARLAQVVRDHLAEDGPVRWEDQRWERCLRCEDCQAELETRDDVLRVAGVHLDQRTALNSAGVTTAAQLAELSDSAVVPGLRPERLARVVAQARLQQATAEGGELTFEVHSPEALGVLPPPSVGDVFFDFEGDPMWHEPGSDDWGLEYLFGCVTVDTGDEEYTDFWAHDRPGEREALLAFLDWLQERRRRWPDLHVYHYADYERAALLRLAARHGVGQEIVDGLLVDGVLVDLYGIVKAAVRVGSPSYSIKKLEPLYMGEERRDDEGVTGGGDSIVEYHRYTQAVLDGDEALATERREDIRQYNEYDCVSTRRLLDWLRDRADEEGVEPTPGRATKDPDEKVEDPHPLEQGLRELAGDTPRADRTPEQQAHALLAAAVQYHRREAKPFWWGHYDRLERTADQWARGADVLVVRSAEVLESWTKPGRGNLRRRLVLRGDMPSGGKAGPGGTLVAVYGAPPPDCLRQDGLPNGCREVRVEEMSTVVDEDGHELTAVVVSEGLPTGADPYDDLPIGLAPKSGPNPGSIVGAIAEVAQAVLDAGGVDHDAVASPATDLLRRMPPRLVGGAVLPRSGDTIADLRDALLALDGSYLAVQGPPGTGKTYVASHVIARLVLDHGWRVGVVAQSHAAVEHLLGCVVAAGVPADQVGKRDPRSDAPDWTVLSAYGHAPFAAGHEEAGRGYVIGGTAWDLTNEKRISRGQLDLVVVDEAGQYALAPTIACSVAGRRLLLLGDPQQLPEVSVGTHAEPVDGSALGWLLDGRATMPPELGYFLATTWRMHPSLTLPVSRLSYEDQLVSHEAVTTARTLDGVVPGLHVVPVDHADRTTSSPEEADAVVGLVQDLSGRAWTTEDGSTRPLVPDDVLVVTPYNHQVRTLRTSLDAAGLTGVRAGTVDRLQGQEAPVVVVSMCASSVHDVNRGLTFLLDRNRLTVAISRAQHSAWVVMSPRLVDAVPRSPHELRALGAFMGLVEDAHQDTGR